MKGKRRLRKGPALTPSLYSLFSLILPPSAPLRALRPPCYRPLLPPSHSLLPCFLHTQRTSSILPSSLYTLSFGPALLPFFFFTSSPFLSSLLSPVPSCSLSCLPLFLPSFYLLPCVLYTSTIPPSLPFPQPAPPFPAAPPSFPSSFQHTRPSLPFSICSSFTTPQEP